jgi:hypothetical protein
MCCVLYVLCAERAICAVCVVCAVCAESAVCAAPTEMSHTQFLFLQNRAVYQIMWKNMVQPDRSQMAIQCCACALNAG